MILEKVVKFYYKYENLNLKIAFILISLQILHLYWLTTDVMLTRIIGESFFAFPQIPVPILVAIDYLEIPALVSGSIFYALRIRSGRTARRDFVLLALLLFQVLHLFWITDEVLYDILFSTVPIAIPPYVAWFAILIDFLEVPVIVDLFYKTFRGKRR